MSAFLSGLSTAVGWIYFTAWSVSFYGQAWENYTRKSCKGFNLDFAVYNFLGFSCYAVYSQVGYLDSGLGTGQVQIQDLVFAYHALLLTIVQLSQTLIYPRGGQKVSKTCWIMCACLVVAIGIVAIITNVTHTYDNIHFNTISFMGYVKIWISLIKYMPQAWYNYRRQSTVGWNIFNIMMDFTGGFFSFMQIVIDSGNSGNWDIFSSGGALNIVKFSLSVISMVFDVLFMIQHYALYTDARKRDEYARIENGSTGVFKNKVGNPSLSDEDTQERLLSA
eukprot:CAMPEP_0114986736 /NCGR_PEP_ID=MMETSP0216-20121206/8593_1 /TAXON_ID=223996 /ORGANISM="Protocruzia adherens, Strain Boccale" /LENGTH=277 /DNA_ID=CAMNT_0002349207 /DNA_START=31 /DNA_END=864 /DNA_ORIENTATION=+